jgi:predicted nucleic acid-binding protein
VMDALLIVDASVWVSRQIPQDVNHAASCLWFDRYTTQGGRLIAPSLLLIEVAAAIARRTGQRDLAQRTALHLAELPVLRLVSLDAASVEAAITVAADRQLRAGDAIYVALAQQLGLPLVSWDDEQMRRSHSLVRTATPTTYAF